jgi:hypothetical protein
VVWCSLWTGVLALSGFELAGGQSAAHTMVPLALRPVDSGETEMVGATTGGQGQISPGPLASDSCSRRSN